MEEKPISLEKIPIHPQKAHKMKKAQIIIIVLLFINIIIGGTWYYHNVYIIKKDKLSLAS
jgi:hypothetical protein